MGLAPSSANLIVKENRGQTITKQPSKTSKISSKIECLTLTEIPSNVTKTCYESDQFDNRMGMRKRIKDTSMVDSVSLMWT